MTWCWLKYCKNHSLTLTPAAWVLQGLLLCLEKSEQNRLHSTNYQGWYLWLIIGNYLIMETFMIMVLSCYLWLFVNLSKKYLVIIYGCFCKQQTRTTYNFGENQGFRDNFLLAFIFLTIGFPPLPFGSDQADLSPALTQLSFQVFQVHWLPLRNSQDCQ